MKKILLYSGVALSALMMGSCDNFFEMRYTNTKDVDQLTTKPREMMAGLCNYGYLSMPNVYYNVGSDYLDCATDNAVSRIMTSSTDQMMTKGAEYLTNTVYPLNGWNTYYQRIRSVNEFLLYNEAGDIVYYPGDEEETAAFLQRTRGECYFTRAYNHADLLFRHAGYDTNGDLMGIVMMQSVMSAAEVELLPRNTFKECVDLICEDLDRAIEMLPYEYNDQAQNGLTAYACTLGALGRATIPAAWMLKSRLLLYAASPAYNLGDEYYQKAAEAAKNVIEHYGSSLPDIYDVSDLGLTTGDKLSSLFFTNDGSEEMVLPRVDNATDTGCSNNFPANVLLGGSARTNPTQNLVDAFPMKNGYPITDKVNSGYSASDMYANRDPRLSMTVIHNGQTFKGVEIQIYPGGADYIGSTGITTTATRTGYYLRKWVSSKVTVVGTSVGDYNPSHVYRKVEAFLNFAEAALEVDGADGTTYGMSARDAIREVRRRAGIEGVNGVDEYLNSLDTDGLRDLIRNERRIELCFENHRYYDLRRWKANLNEPIKGIFYTDASDKVGTVEIIKNSAGEDYIPKYEDYMYYGPIPNSEVLMNENMTQNAGWEN